MLLLRQLIVSVAVHVRASVALCARARVCVCFGGVQFDADGVEEEADDLTSQVLAEIGVEVGSKARIAPVAVCVARAQWHAQLAAAPAHRTEEAVAAPALPEVPEAHITR